MAKIKPISWCHQVLYSETVHANVNALPFTLRFVDFDDLPNIDGDGDVDGYAHVSHS
jgi:hypothetical protein